MDPAEEIISGYLSFRDLGRNVLLDWSVALGFVCRLLGMELPPQMVLDYV